MNSAHYILLPLTNCQPILKLSSRSAVSGHVYTIHDNLWHGIVLWPVWITCPGCAPSRIPVELLSGRICDTKKSLTQDKRNLASTKIFVCCQHSHTKSKTQHCTSNKEKKLTQYQPVKNMWPIKHRYSNSAIMRIYCENS